jgi:GNAT superfamily N-acetyltransferase
MRDADAMPPDRAQRSARVVRRVTDIPGDVDLLLAVSWSAGFRGVATLRDRWLNGENRFDAPGEALFEARDDRGRLVGICGLNVDPYARDPRVGRVRHLYVAPAARRAGVATELVSVVIEMATGRFTTLRTRTYDADAASFYASVGFRHVDEPDATHVLQLSATSVSRSPARRASERPS